MVLINALLTYAHVIEHPNNVISVPHSLCIQQRSSHSGMFYKIIALAMLFSEQGSSSL